MKNKRSFTLIELLVVMGIIGLLIALLFPAIGAARQAANRAKAESEVKGIETAILNYLRDYGRFPLVTSAADRDYTGTDYQNLIRILRGSNVNVSGQSWNARREVYLEVSAASVVNDFLKDPWDRDYRVVVDGDFNNSITLGAPLNTTLVGRSVAVWSTGPDGTNTNTFVRSWSL